MVSKLLFALICVLFYNPVNGLTRYPSPATDIKECNRSSFGQLCDKDNLLTDRQKISLDRRLLSLLNRNINCGKGKANLAVAIAIVKKVPNEYNDPKTKVDDFTRDLFDMWGVGESCGSGMLIVISIDDRESQIFTGMAVKKLISNKNAEKIINAANDSFRDGKYWRGIANMIDALENHLDNSYNFSLENIVDWIIYIISFLFTVFITCLIIVLIISICTMSTTHSSMSSSGDSGMGFMMGYMLGNGFSNSGNRCCNSGYSRPKYHSTSSYSVPSKPKSAFGGGSTRNGGSAKSKW